MWRTIASNEDSSSSAHQQTAVKRADVSEILLFEKAKFTCFLILNLKNRNLLLIVVCYLAFVSLGLPDGLLGISWPYMSRKLDVPLDSLGILLISFVMGYLSTSTTSGKILSRIPLGVLLSLSCALTGLSLLAYAFSSYWILLVIASFFLGGGGGAIDTSINTFAASRFSPSVVNWLHAFYGVGATAGPFIITWMLLHAKEWYDGYILVGITQISLAILFLMTLNYWKVSPGATDTVVSGSFRDAVRVPLFWVTLFIFFVYTGLEMGVGQWIFTILTESRDIAVKDAGLWTSSYYGSLTIGRILFGFILTKVAVSRVLAWAFSGILLGTILLMIPQAHALTWLGIMMIGLSNAPVFPCLISITPTQVGEKQAANMIGFQISAALVGGALLPALGGFLTGFFNWEIIPDMFFIEAIVLLLLHLVARKRRVIHIS